MLITLVGMPGCGKSTVGRQLSRQLDWSLLDTDAELERRFGMPVRSYFELHGEEAFRREEQEVVEQAAHTRGSGIISTGGGAVLRPANREVLRARTQVFYLRASPEELHRRLRHDTRRPLLQVADPLARLRELYRERDPLYRRTAHYVIESARPSVTTLVGMVLMQLEVAGLLDPGRVPSAVDRPSGAG